MLLPFGERIVLPLSARSSIPEEVGGITFFELRHCGQPLVTRDVLTRSKFSRGSRGGRVEFEVQNGAQVAERWLGGDVAKLQELGSVGTSRSFPT